MALTRPVAPARPGFTLVEVALSVLLLGLLAIGVAQSLTSTTDTSYLRHHKSVAQVIATGEIEWLRAAGPGAASTALGTGRVRSDGTSDPAGFYTVAIDTTLACAGGLDMDDNTAETLRIDESACSTQKPVLTYHVTVSFEGRGSMPDTVDVTHQITLTERARYADAYAAP